MNIPPKNICFVLLPGFAPDDLPVQKLKALLTERGYSAVSTNFFGAVPSEDFSKITIPDALTSIEAIIQTAKTNHEKVIGVGISLGGAMLLEHEKTHHDLDGIVSIGTPFRLSYPRLIRIGSYIAPIIYPLYRPLEKKKSRRMFPIGALRMAVDYMQNRFLQGLEKIETHVLFVQSKQDSVADYRVLREYASKCTNAHTEIILSENGTHVMDDNPEVVLGYIERFLQQL